MEDPPVNPLLSTQKPSDADVQVSLHPLPILEVSDHITRAYQREQKGAIVGALLGQQQSGRETTQVTIEHSFPSKFGKNEAGQYTLDLQWFKDRLEQMKQVHKDPALDLVGWYTLVPRSGPNPDYLPIHNQILEVSSEPGLLLGLHLEDGLRPTAGNSLPITIYETVRESEDGKVEGRAEGEDKEMKDPEDATNPALKFRELPYTTDAGDAEMIAIQYIREGGANATVERRPQTKTAITSDAKGKQRALFKEDEEREAKADASDAGKDAVLSKEDSELISALQTKANAVKMMRSRLASVISYLQSLPTNGTSTNPDIGPSQNILRRIQALVTNYELITTRQTDTLQEELLQEYNDVKLISLVRDLVSSVGQIREMGRRFGIAESAPQAQKTRKAAEMLGGKHSVGDAGDLHFG